jgi:hypothetical protein
MTVDLGYTAEVFEFVERYLNEYASDPRATELDLRLIETEISNIVKDYPRETEDVLFLGKDFPGYREYFESIKKKIGKNKEYGADKTKELLVELALCKLRLYHLVEAFYGLLGCIRCIDDPTIKTIAVGRLTEIYRLAVIGVQKSSERKSNRHQLILSKQAEAARKNRAASPQEVALIAAIEAERGTTPVRRPNKEADAILDGVNRRLAAEGFATVKVDVVRRRLEKRKNEPRS